ncbi:hypothetical protein BH09PSE2_BH09PSE2_06640 [soil metagenome]
MAEWAAVCALACVLAVTLAAPQTGTAPDRLLYDAFARLRARTPSDRIVIVAVDAPSLKALGAWPWPRTIHAALIDRLTQGHAAAVAYDVLFPEPDPRGGDPALAAALRRSGRVVLPVVHVSPGDDGAPVKTERPTPLVAAAAAGLGHVDLTPDSDGGVRRLSDAVALGGDCLPRLIDAAATVAGAGPPGAPTCQGLAQASRRTPLLLGEPPRLVAYAGGPGSFRTVSAADVIQGAAPPGLFAGRFVLVGATAAGLGDAYPTPLSGARGPMPGVEILANALDATLTGARIAEPGAAWRIGFALAQMAVLLAAFLRLRPRRLLFVALGLTGFVVAASGGLLLAGVWLSPLPFIAAAAAALPLWSWLRLSAASDHIEAEIVHLGGAASGADRRAGDVVSLQLDGLSRAREGMSAGLRRREEIMQHLSHDLRSPLASILAVIAGGSRELERGAPAVERHARRGLALADSYVQLARAEGLAFSPEPFDLNEALLDAADELHPRAVARHIVIETELGGDDELLVSGDRALVTRALINLLDNAVKYSPDGATVIASTAFDRPNRLVCRVRDEGRGMSPAEVERLFEPFFRAEAADTRIAGAGLGLTMVATVAQRHGGAVSCDSTPGEGTTMTLALPAWIEPR